MTRQPIDGASVIVASVWLLATIAACGWVFFSVSDLPFQDDAIWLEVLAGDLPLGLGWFVHGYNDHNLPLVRALGWLSLAPFHGDRRAGVLISVLAMSGAALATLLALRRVSGSTRLGDALVPLVWLHWGHYWNWLIVFQMVMTLPAAILGTWMAAGLAWREQHARRFALLTGACAVLSAGCGGAGALVCAALCAWSVAAAVLAPRGARREFIAAAAAGAAAWIGYVLLRDATTSFDAANATIVDRVTLAARTASLGFGSAARQLWPWSIALLALLFVPPIVLAARALGRAETRWRASIALAALLTPLLFAAVIGARRSALSENFESRYITLMSPAVVAAYATWRVFGGAARISVWTRNALAVAFAALAVPSFATGLAAGREHRQLSADFRADVQSGMPSNELTAKYTGPVHPDGVILNGLILRLRAACYGPFRDCEFSSDVDVDRVGPFSSFVTQPTFGRPANRIGPHRLGSNDVVTVPIGGELEFRGDWSGKHLSGAFGLFPGAAKRVSGGSVTFSVEFERAGQAKQVLFERGIAPDEHRDDRGPQTLEVDLPVHAEGILFLRVRAEGDLSPRAYWKAIAIR